MFAHLRAVARDTLAASATCLVSTLGALLTGRSVTAPPVLRDASIGYRGRDQYFDLVPAPAGHGGRAARRDVQCACVCGTQQMPSITCGRSTGLPSRWRSASKRVTIAAHWPSRNGSKGAPGSAGQVRRRDDDASSVLERLAGDPRAPGPPPNRQNITCSCNRSRSPRPVGSAGPQVWT